ncbi:DUF1566 domain-containing protein [Pseudomonas sp. MAFF 302030]|uniref:DUF1566 domain-containing protein n=1 Tax=Pseudomonas morbosilactucae TaxID=2938197 RepID=A0A9X1Z8V7_9PSED|nr:DUF1566 domain-containing protein [Pseudomonas morbosilactucae]MCK9802120.1 DUF1566 domain-containing protein [Pseudomonas morbosilactucae]
MQAAEKAPITIPEIGAVWPGQGGIYGGLRQYPEGLCHVIYADQDLPSRYEYGDYGVSVEATSRTDGLTNTQILLGRDGKHPAAVAAAAYTAGGHNDFYLPSIGELHHAWQFAPESFSEEWYYLSSTQRSAYYAFYMHFDDGYQYYGVKHLELLVRPVRRFLQ